MRNLFRKKRDEIEEFLDLFSEERSNPDRSFQENLKKKVLNSLDKNSHDDIIFNSNIMYRLRILTTGIAISFLFIFVFILAIQFVPRNPILDKNQIFKQIEAANLPLLSQSTVNSLQAYKPNLNFPNSDNNFLHVVKDISLGDKYEECRDLGNFFPYSSKYETYQYYGAKMPVAFFRNAAFDSNGKQIYLSTNNGQTSVEYLGGEFAVFIEQKSELPDAPEGSGPEPVSNTMVEFYDYFPSDALLEENESQYIVTWTTKKSCGTQDASSIIHRITSNKNSLEILNEEYFLNEAKEENRIFSIQQKVEIKNYAKDDNYLKNLFTFDLEVPLKDRIAEQPEPIFHTLEEMQQMMRESITLSAEILSKNPELLIIPKDNEFDLTSTNGYNQTDISNQTNNYPYSDRTFFMEGELGDYLYEDYAEQFLENNNIEMPILMVNFNSKPPYDQNNPPPANYIGMSHYISINAFVNHSPIDEFASNFKYSIYKPYKDKEIDLKINNETYKATVFKTGFKPAQSLSAGQTTNIDPNAEETIILFKYKDYTYSITSMSYVNLENLEYTTLDLNGEEMKEYILKAGMNYGYFER